MKTIAMILGALLLTYWGALLYSQISEAIDGIKRHGLKQYLSDGQWVVVAATIVALVGALIGGGVGFIFGGLGGMILGIFVGVIIGVGGAFLIGYIVTSGAFWATVALFCVALAIMGVFLIIKSLWGVGQP